MSDKRLTEACTAAISDFVRDLFTRAPMLADALAELPFDDSDFAGLGRAALQQRAVDGLCAREWYHLQKPPWSPELPLDEAATLDQIHSSNPSHQRSSRDWR